MGDGARRGGDFTETEVAKVSGGALREVWREKITELDYFKSPSKIFSEDMTRNAKTSEAVSSRERAQDVT